MSIVRSSTLVMAAIAVTAAGCSQRVTRESAGDVAIESTDVISGTWGATLRGYDAWPELRGSTFAHVMPDGTRISLSIEGGFPGSNHDWDVREADCGARGRIVGDSTAYPFIPLGELGRGDGVVTVSERLDPAKQYSVNIYSSGIDRSIVVACSPLKR
jgi:hypothetical protein